MTVLSHASEINDAGPASRGSCASTRLLSPFISTPLLLMIRKTLRNDLTDLENRSLDGREEAALCGGPEAEAGAQACDSKDACCWLRDTALLEVRKKEAEGGEGREDVALYL